MKTLLRNPDGSANYRLECLHCHKERSFALFHSPTQYANEALGWIVNPDEDLCPSCAETSFVRYPVPPCYHAETYDFSPQQ